MSDPTTDPKFDRPEGFPFECAGVNLRTSPESIGPKKYACLCNIRSDSQSAIRTRGLPAVRR